VIDQVSLGRVYYVKSFPTATLSLFKPSQTIRQKQLLVVS